MEGEAVSPFTDATSHNFVTNQGGGHGVTPHRLKLQTHGDNHRSDPSGTRRTAAAAAGVSAGC